MKRYLGDILVEEGYININSLNYALEYQVKRLIGDIKNHYTDLFAILQIARSRYNKRRDHLLGKILLELNLTTEEILKKALKLQQEIEKPLSGDKLQKLKAIVTRINSSYNLVDILNQILIYATEIVAAESSSLVIYDKRNDKLVILVPTGPKADKVRELEIPSDRGIVGWVYKNNRSLIINNVREDERFYEEIDKLSGYKTKNILCVPLSVKGERIGAIEVINKNGNGGFTEEDLTLLEIFAAESGIAIDNTRLYYELSEQRSGYGNKDKQIEILKQISKTFLNDLKNSYIPVTGYIDLIRKNTQDTNTRKYASFIKRELEAIIAKTEDIFQFSRGTWGIARKKILFSDLIEPFKAKTWTSCRLSNINVYYDFEKDLTLRVDPEKFLRCLIYLFNNSKEAMPRGGIFHIETKAFPREHRVEIFISDTGEGIPKEIRNKIFEPLFSTNKKYGAGMGLTICKSIIEAHDGKIELLETPNNQRGTLFKITLPI